jgi:hypothetical protein
MKFCPVVPEICRGQVHGARKERRRIIIIIIIRNGAKTISLRIEKSHTFIKVIIVVLLLLLWKFKMFLLILMSGYLDIIIQKHRLMIALKAKFYAFCYKTNSYLMFKFGRLICPVVPEICRGQVHGARKERRIIIIIIIRNGAKTISLPNLNIK